VQLNLWFMLINSILIVVHLSMFVGEAKVLPMYRLSVRDACSR
jgi:hypothetical protein